MQKRKQAVIPLERPNSEVFSDGVNDAYLHSFGRDERKRFGVTEVEQRNAVIHFLIGLVSVQADFGQRMALLWRLVAQVSGGIELNIECRKSTGSVSYGFIYMNVHIFLALKRGSEEGYRNHGNERNGEKRGQLYWKLTAVGHPDEIHYQESAVCVRQTRNFIDNVVEIEGTNPEKDGIPRKHHARLRQIKCTANGVPLSVLHSRLPRELEGSSPHTTPTEILFICARIDL